MKIFLRKDNPLFFPTAIFTVSVIISFFYTLLTGEYNGDFLGRESTLSFLFFFINLVITLFPFYILRKIYNFFSKYKIKPNIRLPQHAIFSFLVFSFLFFTLFVVIFFGVGRMGVDVYDAPTLLKPFIQIALRFNNLYFGLLFIFYTNDKKLVLVVSSLLITIGLLQGGLGIMVYIFLVLSFKYYEFLKKHIILIAFILLSLPNFVSVAYSFRDQQRNVESDVLSRTDMIFGKFIGRFTSLANSAVMLQEPLYFILVATEIDNFYYQKQIIGGIFGGEFIKQKATPEFYMKAVFLKEYRESDIFNATSYTTGTQGNFIFALLKSPFVFLLNFMTWLIMLISIFKLASLLYFPNALEFAYILLLYPITSGVPSEYGGVLIFFILNVALFYFIQIVTKLK